MTETLYVDAPEALSALCARLKPSEWLALDTEFIREKSYYPRLCLIQVATDEVVACIDPLRLDDLSPLLEILFDESVTKVLHAAYQDLEIFYHLAGKVPRPIFDTQIAASLLGYGDQVGYAKLVQAMLGVTLDKSHTRTDWAQRPLEEAQLRYAADDVRYLRELYRQQYETLDAKGRLGWLAEDFQGLSDTASYEVVPTRAWQRIRGLHTLKGRQLAVLRALAAWREAQAMRSDKPRKWILSDDVLVELARRMPTDEERLAKIRGLDTGAIRRHGDKWLEIIETASQEPAAEWPTLPPRVKLDPEQDAAVDALMALLRLEAREHEISPSMIATRKDLEQLIGGEQDMALLHGWRAQLAGHRLQEFLAGRISLQMENGRLRAESEKNL